MHAIPENHLDDLGHDDMLFGAEGYGGEDSAGATSDDEGDAVVSHRPANEDQTHEPEAGSSAKSSLMHVTLGATVVPEHDEEDQLPPLRSIAASLPVASAIRMGSSVPVSIPSLGRWKKADAPPDSPTAGADGFVPPHQFSHVNEYMFSFTGESPSVAIKRDRLRTRNAILKSTGFLEPGVVPINVSGIQERNRMGVAAGGLSQALLQQQGSVPVSAAPAAVVQSS